MASRIAPIVAPMVVTALLAACLAGCAYEKAGADGYRWSYLEGGAEVPRLAYGRPDSDDVALMISCLPGRDQVDVSATGLSGGEIVLASGPAESRFPAARVEDALDEAGLLEARGRADAPALEGFRTSGDLALLVQGQRHSLAAGTADRGYVKAFFKACGT